MMGTGDPEAFFNCQPAPAPIKSRTREDGSDVPGPATSRKPGQAELVWPVPSLAISEGPPTAMAKLVPTKCQSHKVEPWLLTVEGDDPKWQLRSCGLVSACVVLLTQTSFFQVDSDTRSVLTALP